MGIGATSGGLGGMDSGPSGGGSISGASRSVHGPGSSLGGFAPGSGGGKTPSTLGKIFGLGGKLLGGDEITHNDVVPAIASVLLGPLGGAVALSQMARGFGLQTGPGGPSNSGMGGGGSGGFFDQVWNHASRAFPGPRMTGRTGSMTVGTGIGSGGSFSGGMA